MDRLSRGGLVLHDVVGAEDASNGAFDFYARVLFDDEDVHFQGLP